MSRKPGRRIADIEHDLFARAIRPSREDLLRYAAWLGTNGYHLAEDAPDDHVDSGYVLLGVVWDALSPSERREVAEAVRRGRVREGAVRAVGPQRAREARRATSIRKASR